ncbi:hypothetical protein NIES22_07270 [Calothrix brevissima NIES-22]|nr:hypothetical protein NIES22_07270 [Calothrix brevissima NIES-22]
MQKFIWLIVFLILFLAINSKNSSRRDRPINPYSPVRVPYQYVGYCHCPYDLDPRGYECGNRSAYVKNGGLEPVCYFGDFR